MPIDRLHFRALMRNGMCTLDTGTGLAPPMPTNLKHWKAPVHMTRLRISEQAIQGIQALLGLNETEVATLAAALREQVPVKLVVDDEVAGAVGRCLTTRNKEDQELIAGAIVGLHLMLASSHRTEPSFTSDLLETLDLVPASPEAVAAGQTISAILQVQSISLATKAWSLLEENDKIFTDARTITDLRPIFGEDLAPPLAASIITHSLRVTYRTYRADETIFLVMDDDDLRMLKQSIERALEKSRVLRDIIKNFPGEALGNSISYGSEE